MCFNENLDTAAAEVCIVCGSKLKVRFQREKKLLTLTVKIASYIWCQLVSYVTMYASMPNYFSEGDKVCIPPPELPFA